MQMLAELAVLPFFPAGNESVLIALARLVGQMCRTEDEVRWLVDRMTSGIYSAWPGPQEMRACFCSKFRPRDGLNAYSTVYPDGIPLSEPRPRIEPPAVRAFLTAPEPAPEGEEESRFHKDWMANKERAKITQVAPNFKPITQADVDEAVRKHREEKARQERAKQEKAKRKPKGTE
jgi:hypothetical protein